METPQDSKERRRLQDDNAIKIDIIMGQRESGDITPPKFTWNITNFQPN